MTADAKSKPTKERFWSIPVSEDFDARVRERMREGGFNARSEYVRSVVRADLERAEKERVDRLLAAALESGDFSDTRTFLDALRERVDKARSKQ